MYWDRGYYTEEEIRAYFIQTCVSLGYVGKFSVYFDEVIVTRHKAPKRGYHDLMHPAQMLEWFDSHFPEKLLDSELAHLIRLSIFFHDLWDPWEEKAEYYSILDAQAFIRAFGSHLSMPVLKRHSNVVWDNIEATAYHIKPDEKFALLMRNTQVRWILDADLIRFLDPEWQKWADGIRHEYKEHPDKEFNAGRKYILTQFKNLQVFFFTLGEEENARAKALVQEQLDALV